MFNGVKGKCILILTKIGSFVWEVQASCERQIVVKILKGPFRYLHIFELEQWLKKIGHSLPEPDTQMDGHSSIFPQHIRGFTSLLQDVTNLNVAKEEDIMTTIGSNLEKDSTYIHTRFPHKTL